jgi:hypothetical protein
MKNRKDFKLFCINFALFIYNNHIKIDWNIYTKIGKIYYFLPWLIRSIIIWVICPIFLIEYWVHKVLSKKIKKIMNLPEFKMIMHKSTTNMKF